MNCESRITLEETPAFAAAAAALIDDRLSRLGDTARTAYWDSVRKAYNTPYNDPAPGKSRKARKHGVAALGAVLSSAAGAAVGSAAALVQGERLADVQAA